MPKIIFPFIFLLGIWSCQEKPQTPSEYKYEVHHDEEGASPKVGDLVVFHETTFLNGKEMFSTYPFGAKEIVLPPVEKLSQPLPPNYEVLFTMSEGDSVTVWQSLSDLKNFPKGYDENDKIAYVIKLKSITPAAQVLAEKKK